MPSSRSTQPDNAPTALPPKTGRRDDHDPRGRFTPGNRCGQGNPAAKQTAALRQALRAAISPEDITEIAEVLREMALDGNLSAIRLLLSYVIGRPGADDTDDTEPSPWPPEPAAMPEEPAPVVTAPAASVDRPAPAVSPAGGVPTVPSSGPGTETPAPEASRPPSPTVDNGPATRPLPSPPADVGEPPPRCAMRRWPR